MKEDFFSQLVDFLSPAMYGPDCHTLITQTSEMDHGYTLEKTGVEKVEMKELGA